MFGKVKLRKGQPDHRLSEAAFKAEYKKSFYDPRFISLTNEIEKITEQAWQNYNDHRKAPITVKAGADFQDPDYDLSIEWLNTHNRILQAQLKFKEAPSKILLINASPRNEHTCPGETSKSYRLVKMAEQIITDAKFECEILDLSELTSEFGKKIYPCKACVSTAMPLCHWPCSCYPNHSLGQNFDWMNEIYEKWVGAHGIMIVTPVHWYQAPAALKLMMDRLVCADGGNPDPTSTHGKDAEKAKQIELAGWNYPKHLAGRAFSVVVHGDTVGVSSLRRNLVDWLTDMELIPAGISGTFSAYVGYYKPYATSHDDLDEDSNFIRDAENAARSLVKQIELIRSGGFTAPDKDLHQALQK